MGLSEFPEQDWKVFRELREVALARFCQRVLDEIEAVRSDESLSHHQRYADIYQLVRKRDRELAHAFDNPRRSVMFVQLSAIHAYGLLEPEELARFAPGTRDRIAMLSQHDDNR